jgi:predicted Zn-dependent peptidase
VDAEILVRAKTQARAGVIKRLADNSSLANLLVTCHAGFGNWRKIFTSLDQLNKVTAEDVQRVAQKYFVATNRTVAYTRPGGQP